MEPELTPEQSDRLAEALINDVITELVDERQTAVDDCKHQLENAQRALDEVRRSHQDWARHRELDYSIGERVVMNAKLADFGSPAVPPGTHVRAVRSYFERHPPKIALERLTQPHRRFGGLVRGR
ncbi:hypothetical protein [Nakamurella lactea]|uniref:hypothetical protein n=1 Tax=Nakamurella lactea TaxID=459515 RepID=UPI0004050D0E|nr:hypothetical protein [Nakamurella lactea]